MGLGQVLASSIFIFLAVTLPYIQVSFRGDLKRILNGLLYQERRYPVRQGNRVAVGFGSCWDLNTDAIATLEQAKISPPISSDHFDTISSEEELAKVFAYFFQNGAAAERFSSNKDFFKTIVSVAAGINGSYWTIGGNAPVMSQRLAIEGWEVLLAAQINSKTAKQLHNSITLTGNASKYVEEDVHLIMEYDLGAHWGPYVSPRGNRFIIHSDYSNMLLETLDGFSEAIVNFSPNLVVISGLQMMDNFPFDLKLRTDKLKKLESILIALPSTTKVHFEMASFTEEILLKELLEYVIPYADSMGMNEQELANLHSLLTYGSINLVSDYSPRVATALDQGRKVFEGLQMKRRSPHHHSLSRIHIHTLAFQAIFTVQGSGWHHTRTAAAKSSLVANRHVCSSNYINLDNAKLILDDSFSLSVESGSKRMPLMEDAPVSCWYEGNKKICVAPNLVCTAIRKTVGGGDNISAAGLSVQL